MLLLLCLFHDQNDNICEISLEACTKEYLQSSVSQLSQLIRVTVELLTTNFHEKIHSGDVGIMNRYMKKDEPILRISHSDLLQIHVRNVPSGSHEHSDNGGSRSVHYVDVRSRFAVRDQRVNEY